MVAEKSEDTSNRPAVASSQLWRGTRFSAFTAARRAWGAGGIGTLDRALWLSLYVYVWSDPVARGAQPSGLTLPVDSRHKTGTGEVAEWLKAALC